VCRRVDAFEIGTRKRLQRNRLARLAGKRRKCLPKLFGDERNEGMREAKRGLELADQHRSRSKSGCRNTLVFRTLQLDLGQLDIPVAVFVPDEFVESARGEVEAVVVDMLHDVVLGLLQT